MKSPGIHARLLVTAFIIISMTSFSLGFFGVKLFNDFAGNRFDERFQFLAKYLALNAELAKKWKPIIERKDPPADADEWREVKDKLQYLIK